MERKFDYNNDILIYQNMVNEFEILKKLILDKELIEILKFLSKTSISLDSEIQEKRNEELKNFHQKIDYDLNEIFVNFPELLKNYGNNPYIYSKMIENLKDKIYAL